MPKVSSTMEMPTIELIRPNFTRVSVNGVRLWFSYRTPIAFQIGNAEAVVRKNDWGPTTGKHQNAIDGGDKKSRVDVDTFQAAWRNNSPILEEMETYDVSR